MNVTDDQAKEAFSANVTRELIARGKNVRWLMIETEEYPNRIYPAVQGKTMPGAGLLTRVAHVFGLTIDELLKPVEEKSRILEETAI